MLSFLAATRYRYVVSFVLCLLLVTFFLNFRASLDVVVVFSLMALASVSIGPKDFSKVPGHYAMWPVAMMLFAYSHLLSAFVHARGEDIGLMQGSVESAVMSFFLYALLMNRGGIGKNLMPGFYGLLCVGVFVTGLLSIWHWYENSFSEAVALGSRAINSSVSVRLLIATVPFILLAYVKAPIKLALVVICAMAGFVSVVLSYSRAAIICIFLVGLFSLGFTVFQYLIRTRKWVVPSLIGGGLIGLGILIILQTSFFTEVVEGVDNVVLYLKTGDGNTSIGARFEMWVFAIRSIMDAPWTGIGSGTLAERMGTESVLYNVPLYYQHVHNLLLESWLATGVLGFTGALMMLLYPLWVGFKYIDRISGRILLVGCSVFSLYGMISAPFTRQFSLLYYMLFVTFMLVLLYTESDESSCSAPSDQDNA